jgi:hypothetical protein
VFGEEYLSPMKKIPAPKNTTMIETEETAVTGEEKKKSKKDLMEEKKAEKDKDKDNAAPKNAQNAHEAIRPSETDGKVAIPALADLVDLFSVFWLSLFLFDADLCGSVFCGVILLDFIIYI